MKLTKYLYIIPLVLLTACHSEDPAALQKEIDGPILLSAGIAEGGQEAVTKAGAEDHHDNPGHLALTENTVLALQVSGTWSSNAVIKKTTATVGAETANDSKHNNISCSPVLYWDDYGTADPANSAGRVEGLTIYGAAINGKTTVPAEAPTTAGWTIDWTLASDQTATNNTPADKDLLISNNVKGDNGNPYKTDYGRYLFDQRTSGKLLEFTHALSKITVNLKAGAGFTNSAFTNTPTVVLTSNNATTSITEWANTKCKVDVTTGNISEMSTPAVVTMANAASVTANYNATKEALVVPGSQFTTDNAILAKITADGNIYYVTAEKIRTAISANHATDGAYATQAGKNYIINVIVNKTDIVVTATVADWTTVIAATEEPVINVSGNYGTAGGSNATNAFSFYRSTALNNGYSSTTGTYYPADATMSYESSAWTMTPQLYWPNHNTHYQFRGVWPQTVTTDVTTSPRVETSGDYQVIKVWNVAYDDETFPSDLQIARPEIENPSTTYCTNTEPGHTKTLLYDGGICATEGTITLNFRYMMSQVEVNLSTTTGSDAVTLTNAVVEIVNVYNTADVTLGDREVIPTGDKGSYTLDVDGTDSNKRWSAIVPQTLTYTEAQASTNVRFKITITNGDSTTDVYYADVNPILESGKSTKVAPNGKWESGYHYVYNLKLSKTDVNVTATLAQWTTVTAGSDVWF